ncbi:methyltransferase [Enterococcus sp. 10A9_DIV0425]|uniref:Methyltransferase n=1 Tax=Candidatus Enterococcus wittei TaxID=1987383 RepID=A0A242JYY6_9ENTE|nr:methyltransferase domain-containing protein [Enterococcus sp. 10A9_DIV0425]OTP10430.1 methyltransferase [Enterococcus sp. 10A9_DIV0425]THE14576.1 methyltransferase domain-containing protein [Enterococcus hirae]
MLKKIDQSRLFLSENDHLFRCPLCKGPLTAEMNGLICKNNHRFDLSKKGTLYFLSHGVKTEYDQKMFAPRRRMIQSGMYQPVIEAIAKQVPKEARVLDVGCGEGSFLAAVDQLNPMKQAIGFDISKEGVYAATEQNTTAFWCVADLTNLPFSDQQFTTILNIFSPSHYQEFQRVLSDDGAVLKVVPQEGYLKELRQAFYPDQPEKHHYSNERVVSKFMESMDLVERQRVSYEFDIPLENRQDLLAMSPLEWQVEQGVKEALIKNPLKKITIDVELLKGNKRKRFL